ncbi:sulfite exporter TauE/SafE family protein [Desulfosporosinus sp. PR]|uniref:sulfite exporter TauE/SafE family protein n=1 Tax=Candidatus Desulfosporosinus nitrosoreducens TaxID=3401928 RepID=UPI0027EB0003|nr:sulfite exporter TauE/SafE family protein [Desulfosporosinus sp. PR]MDQ7092825.1 sulfite exporter TauE/SafE family protein [Desulfosporosinus sp. PR]
MSYLWVALIALLGSMLQTATGFGFAVVTMALWPFIIPFKAAAATEVFSAFVMVIYISFKFRKHINFKLLLYPTISSLIMGVLGVLALVSSGDAILHRMLGAVLFLLSLYLFFFSEKFRIKPTPRKGLLVGAISGILNGLFNIGGPPMVVYFLSSTDDKLEYSATIQCFFMLSALSVLGMHLAMGNVSWDIAKFSLAAVGGLVLGIFLGMYLFKKFSIATIKKVVYQAMAVFGLFLLVFGGGK